MHRVKKAKAATAPKNLSVFTLWFSKLVNPAGKVISQWINFFNNPGYTGDHYWEKNMTDISFEELIKLKKASNDLVSALTSDAENLEEGALDIGRIAGRFLAASSTLGLCGKGPDNGPDSLKKWDQLAHQTSELAGWLSLLRSDRFPPSFQPYVIQNHIRPKALEISRILKYEGFVETDENYAKTNTRPNQS